MPPATWKSRFASLQSPRLPWHPARSHRGCANGPGHKRKRERSSPLATSGRVPTDHHHHHHPCLYREWWQVVVVMVVVVVVRVDGCGAVRGSGGGGGGAVMVF